MRQLLLLLALLPTFQMYAQDYDFNRSWQTIGPEKKPLEDKRRSSNGIGPIDFIRANQSVKGLILAGSLNGGLFYTEDGGKQWINSGSDDWPYSGCSWAEFHPDNEKVWFANSVSINDNGNAGAIGHQGGIYRTKDGGLNWEMVADKGDFINSEYLVIYGFTFYPGDNNRLIVNTNEGFYETKDCLADEIKWQRVGEIGGWIYDLDFTGENIYISHFQFGKWNVQYAPKSNMKDFKKIEFIESTKDPILNIACEPYDDQILILVNYERKSDEMYRFDYKTGEHERILKNQRVIFGQCRTMRRSPHRPDQIMVGYSTTMQRWSISEKAKVRMRGGYHVDIEGIEYDPFDTNTVYIATHGGVYTSTDNCETWVSTSNGIGIAEVEGIAVSPLDPNRVVIGCYHDGSSVRADWEKNGIYEWKNVNGGDGLLPLLPGNESNVVYTSNQFTGGGLYYSKDTARNNVNIHSKKGVRTPGWQMSAVLHPSQNEYVFFNFQQPKKALPNMELGRTNSPETKDKPEILTDFTTTHGIEKYSVFGLYTSEFHPNKLWLYLLEFAKQEDGSIKNVHRLFMTHNSLDSAEAVKNSWIELEIPRNDWLGDVEADKKKAHVLYLSYAAGNGEINNVEGDFGFIYALKYHKKKNNLKREIDLGSNIPYSFAGKFNITQDGKGGAFFGTRTGIYYGSKKTMKGKGNWTEIGIGLPHCRVHGVFYHQPTETLTIGLYGRGVWKYDLK